MNHFEDLLIKALEGKKNELGKDKGTNTILKMLIEIRESARKNEQYEAYDRIADLLEEKLDVKLREETRIIANIVKD